VAQRLPLIARRRTPRRRNSDCIRRGHSGDGGLIALRLSEVITHRELTIKLAALHRLPAVYPLHIFAADGGLISYGPDVADEFRRAASYVDRILKGEKPGNLPVQAPTKYELVINLKTAKALGLTVPPMLLARADKGDIVLSAREHRRLVQKSVVVDLFDEEIRHVGPRDETTCPVARID
jgi:hypothetical protein